MKTLRGSPQPHSRDTFREALPWAVYDLVSCLLIQHTLSSLGADIAAPQSLMGKGVEEPLGTILAAHWLGPAPSWQHHI